MGRHKKADNGRTGTLQNKDCNDPYANLAYAIVLKACEDYEATLRLSDNGFYPTHDMKYAKEFLFSEEPEYLTGISGRLLAKKIREKVRKEAGRVYRRQPRCL